ncbi:MFS general substrate transporter, partial [Periconia macrospinosa]
MATNEDVEKTVLSLSSEGAATLTHDMEQQPTADDATDPKDDIDVKDPDIVDWEGEDDPENPLNWPLSKKLPQMFVVSFITMLSPFASTMSASATPLIMEHFHSTNEILGSFVTSIYILGYAFGPLVWGPLSELYGRQHVYNASNFLFLVFSIACAVANNMGALVVFRFLAGFAASCPITISSGTVADLYSLEKRGKGMSAVMLGPLFGPTVGPIAAGYLAEAKGWRWTFWLITILAGAASFLGLLLNRETYAYTILKRKTMRLQKETGNTALRSKLDTGKTPKQLFQVAMIRPIKMLIFSPPVLLMSIVMAAVYGYLYLLLTTFPRVFGEQYSFSQRGISLIYLGTGIGTCIGLLFSGAVLDRVALKLKERNGGIHKPEYRLPAMILGMILIPIGLFLYGWTAEKRVHWIAPLIGTGFLGGGMIVMFMPSLTYLIDMYTIYAASVSAASTVLRSLVGALLPLAGPPMYDALGIGWGNSLLGFIATACIPVPIAFWIFGERIR